MTTDFPGNYDFRMRVAARLAGLRVRPASVACVWLGQAGYLIKAHSGLTVMIDPYFSDEGARLEGLTRLFTSPITANEFHPDILLVSHGHLDHFDDPTIRTYAAGGRTTLMAPPSCTLRALALGWPASKLRSLQPGTSAKKGGCEVTATFARHTLPDAIGFHMSIDGIRFWHSGDTEYDAGLRTLVSTSVDVAFICINGGGGNMNAHEAAFLIWQLKPRVVVPMHYGLWSAEDYRYHGAAPNATPDPALFATTLATLGSRVRIRELKVGQPVTFS
jgi:L-ascorbate metabolism protein UlaG (beta-lactamase superfamily)